MLSSVMTFSCGAHAASASQRAPGLAPGLLQRGGFSGTPSARGRQGRRRVHKVVFLKRFILTRAVLAVLLCYRRMARRWDF